jgi:hypothetical protein
MLEPARDCGGAVEPSEGASTFRTSGNSRTQAALPNNVIAINTVKVFAAR